MFICKLQCISSQTTGRTLNLYDQLSRYLPTSLILHNCFIEWSVEIENGMVIASHRKSPGYLSGNLHETKEKKVGALLPKAKLKGREPITALIESWLSVIRYHPPSSIPQVERRQPKSITTRPTFPNRSHHAHPPRHPHTLQHRVKPQPTGGDHTRWTYTSAPAILGSVV
ncbi:hypothetical protein I7I51_09036 [Histoplasma capsulatum]|uniref:Uncharacterized protein n=1 Tax=Ajellomyces capsulatus TaxID=5037 RepID=A0A8A1M2M8_AJECA|nr:predicted protein [Histoplasma mississippiense (nom. inval.)]EDN06649.1 predicted protein [Histoplasma mississippiense (nom. inval.)]QSS59600.1 hypothetical protein I7I51_09036 [Histoplasma capsulatum]